MLRKILTAALASGLFVACSTPSVITTFKLPDAMPQRYQTILVVGIIKEDSTLIRAQVEDQFSAELKKSGYHVLTAMSTFGATGLSGLPREETFARLCNNGIDAVLTLALIDGKKEKFNNPPHAGAFPGSYYLERIWNYAGIEADATSAGNVHGAENFWEAVLFDLYALQPHCVLQTRSSGLNTQLILSNEVAKRIVGKLIREKAIKKQNGNNQPKPAVAKLP